MTYYVVTLDGLGRIEERGITGPYDTVPALDAASQPHALVIEIADGGTVKYAGPRALKCSAPSRVTVHGEVRG